MMCAAYLSLSSYLFFRFISVLFCISEFMIVGKILCKYILCILNAMYVPFWVFCFTALFCVLFVCMCVLYYCCQVPPQLQ